MNDALQQAVLREGVRNPLANDDVIQYPNIDQRQRCLQLLGQRTIGARRLSDTRGVLVREDHCGGFQLQYTLHETRG